MDTHICHPHVTAVHRVAYCKELQLCYQIWYVIKNVSSTILILELRKPWPSCLIKPSVRFLYLVCDRHAMETFVIYMNTIHLTGVSHVLQGLFVNVPSQWETALHCNVVFHWLGAYAKWSLVFIHFWYHAQYWQGHLCFATKSITAHYGILCSYRLYLDSINGI